MYSFLYNCVQVVLSYPLVFFSNPFVSGGVVDLGDYLFSRLLGVLFGSFSFIVSISVVQLGFMSAAFNFCLPG